MKYPIRLTFIAASAAFIMPITTITAEEPMHKVLILSGMNNHDWRSTTPVIKETLLETGKFEVDVEEDVGNMKPDAFDPYAVILSNYNTFDQHAPDIWGDETRQAFLDHIAKGNGLVIVHAGSSVFYDWPEFHELACGTWGEGTGHGPIHINQMTFTDVESPITEGLEPFWIRDEFWHKMVTPPNAVALGVVTATQEEGGTGKPEPLLFKTEIGGGRGFGHFLGHDAIAMQNPAWRSLLQRGTEWAATGKVTIPPTENWPTNKEDAVPTPANP